MLDQKSVSVVNKKQVPPGKVTGSFTFLRDKGKNLAKDQALQIKVEDAKAAKQVQSRWRAYFKGKAHSRRDIQPDGSIMVYLWLE